MSDYRIEMKGRSDRAIAQTLRGAADSMDPPKRLRGQFWAGLIVGALLMGAANYGDVWICTGACDANSKRVVAGDRP